MDSRTTDEEEGLLRSRWGSDLRWDDGEGLWSVRVPSGQWKAGAIFALERMGYRLASLWGVRNPAAPGATVVHAIWLARGPWKGLHISCALGHRKRLQTLLVQNPSARYFERELHEMFGVEFESHADLRPLLLHEAHPTPPMAGERSPAGPSTRLRASYRFVEVEGDGVYEVPVGPVHAGVIEPGHFRFQVVGEEILRLSVRLGYTHKGTELLAEGRSVRDVQLLAESVSGDMSLAGGMAFDLAVEAALSIAVPEPVEHARGLLLEMERVAFLLGDVAGIALDVGYARGAARANRLREDAYGVLLALTGSRLGRGALGPGGLRRPLDPRGLAAARTTAERISRETKALHQDLLGISSVVDRLHGTGVVRRELAEVMGFVGPTARASGVPTDVRVDRRYGPYRAQAPELVTASAGDVGARLEVKVGEVLEACRLVLDFSGSGSVGAQGAIGRDSPTPLPEEGVQGLGVVESPRGEMIVWVSLQTGGRVSRFHVRDPSYVNWPAIEYAVEGNIVPDFPLCNKSLNLSYSGFDR